ncbi:MAG TPA: response regulator [Xanthobacteraceae bacterium]|nr:response regulator [Xanthobacteraceae bacterium]
MADQSSTTNVGPPWLQIVLGLIASGSTILLSGVAIYAAYRLFPVLIDLARTRQVSVKIGGMEISIASAAESFTKQIIDLQERLSKLEEGGKPSPLKIQPQKTVTHKNILWVDDKPDGNALQIQKLIQDGHSVILAETTAEAILSVSNTKFDLIISDMGRWEGLGLYRPDAGLKLVSTLKDLKIQTPIVLFTTHRAIENYGQAAQELGIFGMTNSPVELYALIDRAFSKQS